MSDWFRRAEAIARQLAASGRPFTQDDITDAVGFPDAAHSPNGRNNEMGALLNKLQREGVIERIGDTKSRQPSRKGGRQAVWRGTQAALFA
jgi:hypothetical protein